MSPVRRSLRRKQHGTLLMLFVTVFSVLTVFLLWKGIVWYRNFLGRNTAYDAVILQASRRNGVDPRLVKAVVWRESRFDMRARGKAGEIGLMQIIPEHAVTDWAKAHGRQVPPPGALFSPQLNIEIGSWYLANAIRRWGRYKDCLPLALCEYNAGIMRAAKWKPANPTDDVRPRIAISSTLSYVNSILSKYDEYKTSWSPE